LGGFTIPWPSLNEQRAASAALLAIEAHLRAFTAELAALRRFRADLLFALLSQEIAVGEAVDQILLGGAE
jgi:hypothetical protein